MINAIIIDDDKNCRDTLSALLQDYCTNVKILAQCKNVAEGINTIKELNPDLVFLDVEMPDGTGFDLLQQIGAINFEVIFTTGFDKYAVRAFKFSALDFLLKPVVTEELISAVHRFENKKSKTDTALQMSILLSNIKDKKNELHKIAIPTSDGLNFIEVNDIIRLEADGNYTTFITPKAKHVVSKTLKEYDELLSENNFLRIHQTHLVNLNHVKKYVRGEGGYLVMNDEVSVPVSVRKKPEVLERLARF